VANKLNPVKLWAAHYGEIIPRYLYKTKKEAVDDWKGHYCPPIIERVIVTKLRKSNK